MGDLFVLNERQMARISSHFPPSHGVPRVDDRRVVSGIVYVIRNGLQWKDAPKDYSVAGQSPHRRSRLRQRGVSARRLVAIGHRALHPVEPKPENPLSLRQGPLPPTPTGVENLFAKLKD